MIERAVPAIDPDRRLRRRPQGMRAFGAIDVGTNNCRLLVAYPNGETFRVIDAFSRIVRLGEGVAVAGKLSEAAIERTVEALKVCADKLRNNDVYHYRAVATEACRQAANHDVFVERASSEAGISIEVISTEEEAQLALDGCMPLLDTSIPNALLFDIGGGSTELIWVRMQRQKPAVLDAWISISHGVLSLAELHGGKQIDQHTFDSMVAEFDKAIQPFAEEQEVALACRQGKVQLLGTSGTMTAIAAIHLGLTQYDRNRVDGLEIGFSEARSVIEAIIGRKHKVCRSKTRIGCGREEVFAGGCAILESIMCICPAGKIRVADRGLREGILLQLISSDGPRLTGKR